MSPQETVERPNERVHRVTEIGDYLSWFPELEALVDQFHMEGQPIVAISFSIKSDDRIVTFTYDQREVVQY